MIEQLKLEQDRSAILLPVRAQPNSGKNQITGIHAGRLKVSVTPSPEKGKANKALLTVIQKELKLKRSQIELHKGDTATLKVFRITDIALNDLQCRIANRLNSPSNPDQ